MPAPTPPLPDRLLIEPLTRPVSATVRVPGSKSITTGPRVLAPLCSRAQGRRPVGCLRSEDTEVMIAGLRQLGFEVEADWNQPEPEVTVCRRGRVLIPAASADLFVA